MYTFVQISRIYYFFQSNFSFHIDLPLSTLDEIQGDFIDSKNCEKK